MSEVTEDAVAPSAEPAWKGLTPRHARLALALFLGGLIAGALVKPIVRVVHPAIAVEAAFTRGGDATVPGPWVPVPGWPGASSVVFGRGFPKEQLPGAERMIEESMRSLDRSVRELGAQERGDPWGRPWAYRTLARRTPSGLFRLGVVPYSIGPDGVDQRGEGDDLTPLPTRFGLLAWALHFSSPALTLAGALAAWFLVISLRWPTRHERLKPELGRALVVVALPLIACTAAVVAASGGLVSRLVSPIPPDLRGVLPIKLMLIGTFGVVSWLAALVFRLRRPQAEPATETAPSD